MRVIKQNTRSTLMRQPDAGQFLNNSLITQIYLFDPHKFIYTPLRRYVERLVHLLII